MGLQRLLIRAAAVCALALATATGVAAQGCSPDRVDLRGDFGTVRFSVELARTPEEHSRGLMFRESMPRMAGMLFVYPREAPVSFWMRNTLIPLDMIFADDTGTIVRVHANAVPRDETPIPSGEPVLTVLEINGGLAARLGIDAGDELRSPALPQDLAAWPCG